MTIPTTPAPIHHRLLRGKARMRELAAEAETERLAEAAQLLADLGREPSRAELIIIEQLTTLIVRGRRLRQAGRGADAEMVARLVIRGIGKLNIKPGSKPPETLADYLQRTAQAASATPADESDSAEENYRGDDERVGGHPDEATA